jgi:hypothetical protein
MGIQKKESRGEFRYTGFNEAAHDATLLHPSIEEKGIMTMRLHRLHLSSNPPPTTLAISCPHSQRVSLEGAPVG